MQKAPIMVAVFSIAIAGAFYFLYSDKPAVTSGTSTFTEIIPGNGEARQVPEGWKEYRNITYRFSLLYPEWLAVNEYPEGGGATTITFQNVERGEGFQLFILPYSSRQVSEERFKKDVPSGVRLGLTDTSVDGATGAAFYSESATLGETREVWFIHGGFLFEATVLKPLEGWFDGIIQTWEFL